MTAPTDDAIRAYAASLIRAYAAGFDYLDLAERMFDDDTIGDTRIADLAGPDIDDLQKRILDAVHAWGNDEAYVGALATDNTPHGERLAQIRARHRYLAQTPFQTHGHIHGPGCPPCELVLSMGDVQWLLAEVERLGIEIGTLLEEKAAAFVDATTMFKGLTIRDGQAHLEIEPAREMILIWCASVRAMLDEHQAKNYTETELEMLRPASVSLDVQDGQNPTDSYTLTLQRRYGKTPHQLREQAERERDEVRAELTEVRERIGEATAEYGLQYGAGDIRVLRAQDEIAYYKQQRHTGLRVRDVHATQWRPAPEAGCRSCGTTERVLGDPPLCTNCANCGGLPRVAGEWKAADGGS